MCISQGPEGKRWHPQAGWVKGENKGGETSCRDTGRVVPGAWRELELWEGCLGKALAMPEECPGTAGPSPLTPSLHWLTPLEAGGLGSLPGAALGVAFQGQGTEQHGAGAGGG